MTVSDWWMFLSFYQNVLALPLGIVLVVLLLRAKTRGRRMTFAGLLVLAFLPHIQVHAGNLYFDYLCRTQAGEVIYRTVDNVEGILQMRPRDGSKDYFDRMAMGDIPEDPWGHTNAEAQEPWVVFRHYAFFEKRVEGAVRPQYAREKDWHPSMFGEVPKGAKYVRFNNFDGRFISIVREFTNTPRSDYGYTWRQNGNPVTWLFNIYPGEIQVLRLESNETLAIKKGFFRTRPTGLCGGPKDETFAYDFVSKVLRPATKSSVSLR